MSVTLDGQDLFEEQGLEIQADSFGRDCIERSVPGLDGVVSVDLGGRGRRIRQNGVLRARSRLQMVERMAAISGFMDGAAHLLVTKGGEQFDNLRMDSFKVTEERVSGGGVVVDYEIIYTQLV
jgi:hypothetical protein